MYSSNLKNNVKKCYVNLKDSNVDPSVFCEFFEILMKNKKNIVDFIFDYGSMSYFGLQDIFMTLCSGGANYQFLCNDLNEIETCKDNGNFYFLNNVFYKVDGNFSEMVSKNDVQASYISNILQDFDPTVKNVLACDILINKTNIYGIQNTLRLLTKYRFYTRLGFQDRVRSHMYDNPNLITVNDVLDMKIDTRLLLEHLLNNEDYLISNRKQFKLMCDGLFDKTCDIDSDLTFISLDSNFRIRLCPNICGKNCPQLDPFLCFDKKTGYPTEMFLQAVKDDMKNFCCDCYAFQNL